MKFMNHQEFAAILGCSRAKLYRLIKKFKIKTDGGLLSPKDQTKIKKTLGFEPEPHANDVRQNETF